MDKPNVLADTSSWIHWLRAKGDQVVRDRVDRLIVDGRLMLCPPVRLELWNGARGDSEKSKLRKLEARMPEVDITPEVWEDACELAEKARLKGLTVPSNDLLIFACARYHGLEVEADDAHFGLLKKL